MKTMKDNDTLYLKCNVLLLADVFEKFKNNSLKNYGICLSYYFSTPALTWDAMLNMTEVEFELISDADLYLFFEKGMRGGISYISKKYGKANNMYLRCYDPKQKPKHTFLDVNNLYAYAMSSFLPTSRFK